MSLFTWVHSWHNHAYIQSYIFTNSHGMHADIELVQVQALSQFNMVLEFSENKLKRYAYSTFSILYVKIEVKILCERCVNNHWTKCN